MIRKLPDGSWEAVAASGWVIGKFDRKRDARNAEMDQKAKELKKRMEGR